MYILGESKKLTYYINIFILILEIKKKNTFYKLKLTAFQGPLRSVCALACPFESF